MYSRIAAFGVVCLVLIAGCVGSPGGRDLNGTVDIYVGNHDDPIERFERLNVTVSAVTFVPADRANGDVNTPTNGTEIERFESQINRTTVDLTTVHDDSAALVDRVSLPVRERYQEVLVTVSVSGATLSSGEEANVTVPNGTLTLTTRFAVEPSSRTSFLIDMTARGSNGTYNLTATGAPVERNLTTPTAGGTASGTTGTETAGGGTPGDDTAGNTTTTGTATPTATTATATSSGTQNGTASGLPAEPVAK